MLLTVTIMQVFAAAVMVVADNTGIAAPPWCTNKHAPATVGMYGDIGAAVGITGPTGALGQFVDLPPNPEVVGLFNQGLMQLWGFNHVEANRNFQTAIAVDGGCVLCYWGKALSYAPNVNYVIEDQLAFNTAAIKAQELADKQHQLTRKTKLLVQSLTALVQQQPFQPDNATSPFRKNYASMLCNTTLQGVEAIDADIDAFCAGALMALAPWNYYEGVANGRTSPLKVFLHEAKKRLLRSDGHPFAIHLLIHLVEPSNAPGNYRYEALNATNVLFNSTAAELVPAQGHLTHMPAHLYLRVGHYHTGVTTSQVTIVNNQHYLSQCTTPYGYGHNIKMLVANARFAGMYKTALHYATMITQDAAGNEASIVDGVTCVDCAGPGSPEFMLTHLRFGCFACVLEFPQPAGWGDTRFAAYHEAAFHYARAAALFIVGGNVSGADAEVALATTAALRDPEYAILIPQELAAIRAWHVMGNATLAYTHMTAAVYAHDMRPYMEPPRWYYPPRECLATALLEEPPVPSGDKHPDGDVRNATRALELFTKDLDMFPNTGWSLLGASQAYALLGDKAQSQESARRAQEAWVHAEQPLTTPCFLFASSKHV
eukprot:m.386828 g.386828  ORF g.386828 m.386828 type:complete len:600 (-) comp21025_c0_seq2:236-2035(-)